MNSLRIFFQNIKNDKVFHYNFIKSAVIFVAFYWFLFYIASELNESNIISRQNIELFITHYRSVSWPVYVFTLVIAIMSFIPDTPIVLVGGHIFGPIIGSSAVLLSILIGLIVYTIKHEGLKATKLRINYE